MSDLKLVPGDDAALIAASNLAAAWMRLEGEHLRQFDEDPDFYGAVVEELRRRQISHEKDHSS